MKIDIITGFLGAGKTTFISGYGKHLLDKGERVLVIENEFGVLGIDGSLLKQEKLEVVELSGGCACCTQKTGLVSYIREAYDKGYDRAILEPSGIYNLDTFFDLLEDPLLKDACELNAIITIVKPDFIKYGSENYRNIFMSQFLSTGAIVFSNTQSYESDYIDNSLLQLCDFAKENNSLFDIANISVYTKPWDTFTESDFENLSSIGRSYVEHKKILENHVSLIENHFFSGKVKEYKNIEEFAEYMLSNYDVLRMKGFMKADGKIYAVNYTDNCKLIKESYNKHTLINILGVDIDCVKVKEKLKSLS